MVMISKQRGGMEIGEAVDGGTAGSVLFVDASGNLGQDNSNLFWDDSNNRLGIGTTSPNRELEVNGAIAAGDSDAGIVIRKSPTVGEAGEIMGINPALGDYNRIVLRTNNSANTLVATEDGDVGIGTTTPSKTLDVNGDISLEAGSGDYYSNDGSQGWTGTFTNGDGDTVTVKNGIITGVA